MIKNPLELNIFGATPAMSDLCDGCPHTSREIFYCPLLTYDPVTDTSPCLFCGVQARYCNCDKYIYTVGKRRNECANTRRKAKGLTVERGEGREATFFPTFFSDGEWIDPSLPQNQYVHSLLVRRAYRLNS